MKSLALAAFFAVACSSSTPKLEHQTFQNGEGLIEVALVGATQPKVVPLGRTDFPQNISLQIEVSNNSNDTVTVTRVQVDQHGMGPIQIDPAQSGFNESIDPGHDHTFTINTTGKQVSAARLGQNNAIVIRVVVALANGDSYVETFSVPVVDQT